MITEPSFANDGVGFEEYEAEWLAEIDEGNPSSVEKAERFARRLLEEALEVGALEEFPEDNMYYCDGSNDGGIDLAVLYQLPPVDPGSENDLAQVAWYIFQNKYNSAFAGEPTLYEEGLKLFDTIEGKNSGLNEIAREVASRVQAALQEHGKNIDAEVIVVIGTSSNLDDGEKQALGNLNKLAAERFGGIVRVESMSIKTLYERTQNKTETGTEVTIRADFTDTDGELTVATVRLHHMFAFLQDHKTKTRDDREIYKMNLRNYLGRTRINSAINRTLDNNPERFGSLNNGVTIVASTITPTADPHARILTNPYIVNGCQTTTGINRAFREHDSGGTDFENSNEDWPARARKGVVVTKLVVLADFGEKSVGEITKATNDQNAISGRDFHALEDLPKRLAVEYREKYKRFLEIQRGSWSAESKREKKVNVPREQRLEGNDTLVDLLKVYGAGWLSMPGVAFSTNTPFTPDGDVFKTIKAGSAFTVDELYAASRLRRLAREDLGFGKRGSGARSLTTFLFYYVFVEIVRMLMRDSGLPTDVGMVTRVLLKVFDFSNAAICKAVADAAGTVIERYMNKENPRSVTHEKAFANDLNKWLKNPDLGQDRSKAENLEFYLEALSTNPKDAIEPIFSAMKAA